MISVTKIWPHGAVPTMQVKEILEHTRARLRAQRPERVVTTTSAVPSATAIKSFYNSWQWKRLRYAFLKDKERKCQCCGASPKPELRSLSITSNQFATSGHCALIPRTSKSPAMTVIEAKARI